MSLYSDLFLYIFLFLVFVIIAGLIGYILKLKEQLKSVKATTNPSDELRAEIADSLLYRRGKYREKVKRLCEQAVHDIMFFDDEARENEFKKLSQTSYPYIKSYLMGMMYDHIYNTCSYPALTSGDHKLIESYAVFYTKAFVLIFNGVPDKPLVTEKLTFHIKPRGIDEEMNISMRHILYLFKVDLIAHSNDAYGKNLHCL